MSIACELAWGEALGDGEGAISIAGAVYVPVAILREQTGLEGSLYEILPIVRITLFEKTPSFRALQNEKLRI